MNAHDWKPLLTNAKVEEYVSFSPWAFIRPDGSVATAFGSSRAIILVDGNHTEASPIPHDQKGPGVRPIPPSGKSIDFMFANPAAVTFPSTVAAIREVVPASFDVTNKFAECPNCRGTGHTECYACEHDIDCDECDATGTLDVQEEPEHILVKIGGHRFDTWHFGRLLRMAPDGDVAVMVATTPHVGLLTIAGDGWRLLAASTTQTEDVKVIDFPPVTIPEPTPLAHPSETAP